MILPESTFHGSNEAPASGFSSVVPASVQSRVTIGPAPAWVQVQLPDDSYRPPGGNPYTHVLFDEQYHAGFREHYSHTVQRLETLSAVRESSQWRLDFDPATQEIVIHSLIVRRDGVAVDHAQPARLRFLQRENSLESLSMHGHVTVLVLLEDVRAGDLLDFSYTARSHPRFLRDRYWFMVVAPYSVAYRAWRVSIRFPAGRPFAWKAHDPAFKPAIEELDSETKWQWSMENTEAIEPEAQVPGWQMPAIWVQVSDCASWAEVVTAFWGAWQEMLHDPEVTRKAEEIAASAATLSERVVQALDFVQDEIRYLSVNIELGGQIPSPPGEVLRRRYGDCKDKSFLLSQLLRRLGVSARPVLVNTYRRQSLQELLPMPDLFNHAVCEYELDGRRFWADATATLQGGGALHRPVSDFRLGLPLSPDVIGLEPAPATAPDGAYELHETYYPDTTGKPSQLLVQVIARGAEAEQLRRSLASEGKDAFAKSREQFYRQMYDVKRLQTLEWHDDRAQNVLVLGEAYELPTAVAAVFQGQRGAFRVRAHLIASLFGYPDVDTRRQPLSLPFPCQVEHRVAVVSTATPPQRTQPGDDHKKSFEVRYRPLHGPNLWGFSFQVKMLRDSVPARHFVEHKKFLSKLISYTIFDIILLPQVPSLWKRRAFRNLLPSAGPAFRPAPEAPLETRDLPAEPAPVLRSLAPAEPRATIAPAKKKMPAPTVATFAGEAAPALAPELRKRRRRSTRRPNKVVFILVAVGLVLCTAVLVVILATW